MTFEEEANCLTKILDLTFFCYDLDREISIRGYFKELLKTLFEEEEGFDGKRPFGNSGWEYDIIACLVKNKIIKGDQNEDGQMTNFDEDEANKKIQDLIKTL